MGLVTGNELDGDMSRKKGEEGLCGDMEGPMDWWTGDAVILMDMGEPDDDELPAAELERCRPMGIGCDLGELAVLALAWVLHGVSSSALEDMG